MNAHEHSPAPIRTTSTLLQRLRAQFILIASAIIIIAAQGSHSFAADKWEGRATNLKGDFKYGKVTFTVSGSRIKNLQIEAVTTSGCGGFKNVIVPSVKIRKTRFSASYRPIPGIDDIVRVSGTISNGKARGTFSEGPLCVNAGKFSAKRIR